MNPTLEANNGKWFQQITVEPTMFLYMFAFQITSVIEQNFFLHKACLANHNYSIDICENLADHKDINKEVQITASNFHQWNSIAAHIYPIAIALFVGSWSDRRGRKLPLLIGLFGKFIYVVGILLNAHFVNWPVEYIIYTATIPSALTGSDVVIFATAFAYIADVSSIKNRTLRVAILDVTYLVTFPIGIALGSHLFNHVVSRSYSIMFCINGMCLLAAIIYSIVNLKWRTTTRQRSIAEVGCTGVFADFFDKKHVIDSLKTLTKPRPMHRRLYLWIFLLAMFFYTFQRDERQLTFLYTQYKFKWNVEQFSNFKTFQSTTQILMLFAGVPIMTKLFKWQDTTIAMVGAFNFAAARVFFAFADLPWVFYVGAAISSIGPVGGPILRSMTSKVVAASERGKAFALLSVCDNSVPFVSAVLYSQIYNATIGKFPGIYFLTFVTQLILFVLMLIIHRLLNGQALALPQDSDHKNEQLAAIDAVIESGVATTDTN